jgi:hypothetical protein
MIKKTENMLRYEKVHNDCREIFKGDRDIVEKLNNFNDYLNNHLNDDNGMIRTLLVIGKPFKNNPIVKDNLEFLANKLRINLNVDFI